MNSYQFNINEGQQTATLTIQANDEQTARQQAQQLLKTSESLGNAQNVTNQQSQGSQSQSSGQQTATA